MSRPTNPEFWLYLDHQTILPLTQSFPFSVPYCVDHHCLAEVNVKKRAAVCPCTGACVAAGQPRARTQRWVGTARALLQPARVPWWEKLPPERLRGEDPLYFGLVVAPITGSIFLWKELSFILFFSGSESSLELLFVCQCVPVKGWNNVKVCLERVGLTLILYLGKKGWALQMHDKHELAVRFVHVCVHRQGASLWFIYMCIHTQGKGLCAFMSSPGAPRRAVVQ